MKREDINSLNWCEYNKLMIKEFTKENIPCYIGIGGDTKWYFSENAPYPVINSVTRQSQVDLLEKKGLVNNGRCPQCGGLIDKNIYTYEHSMYHYKYFICKNCYKEGRSYTNPHGGCLVTLLLMPLYLIKFSLNHIFFYEYI